MRVQTTLLREISLEQASYPHPLDPYLRATLDNRYQIESILGSGGMGVIYTGRHKVIRKKVAIKILRREMTHDQEMLQRFLQEAQAAARIEHPNVIEVLDFGLLPDGSACLIMEFLQGRTLANELQRETHLPMDRLLHIAKQIAAGLQVAHEQQVVHRDLKPENIFLVERGGEKDFVKILDFGVARITTEDALRLTRTGVVFGTPHYMAPEQAAGSLVDHRADIYALGVILYEMVSGKPPFFAGDFLKILAQQIHQTPPSLRPLVSQPLDDTFLGLESIITKALSKEPNQRYQHMRDVFESLEQLANMQRLPPQEKGRGPSATRRIWWHLAVMITAIVVVVSLAARVRHATVPSSFSISSLSTIAPTSSSTVVGMEHPAIPEPALSTKPIGLIRLEADPADAEIFQEGKLLGKLPLQFQIFHGKRIELELRRAGYVPRMIVLLESSPSQVIRLDRVKTLPSHHSSKKEPASSVPKLGKISSQGEETLNPWAKN